MVDKVGEKEVLRLNLPEIYNILVGNGLENTTNEEMLKEIEDYKEIISNKEDFLKLKLFLKGEKYENIVSRQKLFATFLNFHRKFCEEGLDDYTFQEMINEYETIKEITNIYEKDAELILKVLNGEEIEKLLNKSESQKFIEYIKEKNLNVSQVICEEIIKLNLKNEELKNLKIGEIKNKFGKPLKESNYLKKVIDECK